MLVTTIDNGYQLEQLFRECGRENHFSCEGFNALYDYLDEYSDTVGEDFKVDVIALCCDFTEYEDWEELYNNYSYSYNNESKTFEELEEDGELDDFKGWVQDRTTVIEVTDYKNNIVGIIIQNF
ncbi:MAG: hypothetical protein MSS80_03275 [Mollicutes bacterium]|nr:hypothetical protein [Mollicutes bacterium]